MKLQYGALPQVADAIDLGTVPEHVAPVHLENRHVGWNNEQAMPHYGAKIPPHRRVLMAVAYYRGQGVLADAAVLEPYRVEIPKLGTLVFQTDRMGGGIDWAVIGKDGEVKEV